MQVLSDEACAKVNLTLRVNGRRADGYHDLESVVAFADCADRLTLTPGSDLNLKMLGPLAQACGAGGPRAAALAGVTRCAGLRRAGQRRRSGAAHQPGRVRNLERADPGRRRPRARGPAQGPAWTSRAPPRTLGGRRKFLL